MWFRICPSPVSVHRCVWPPVRMTDWPWERFLQHGGRVPQPSTLGSIQPICNFLLTDILSCTVLELSQLIVQILDIRLNDRYSSRDGVCGQRQAVPRTVPSPRTDVIHTVPAEFSEIADSTRIVTELWTALYVLRLFSAAALYTGNCARHWPHSPSRVNNVP